jgi:hypothetical protein
MDRRRRQRRTPARLAGLIAAVFALAACSATKSATTTAAPSAARGPASGTATATTSRSASTGTPPPIGSSPLGAAESTAAESTAAESTLPASVLAGSSEPAALEPSPAPGESASTPPEEVTAAQTTTQTHGFVSTISEIDPAIAARMGSSWHPGCPVPLSDLRYLTVAYRGFDGTDHDGELVVAASVATDVTDIFSQLYDAGYPIASMRLVDDFGGSDDASMSADNSSAFNCRPVTGGGGFSEHSYGTAIDLNPVENPYLSGSLVLPPAGRAFVDRPDAPGVIQPGDAVVRAFRSHGWTWGGTWSGPIDYQHFSVSGR